MDNINVKLYEIRTSGSGGDVVKRKSLWTEDKVRSQYLTLSLRSFSELFFPVIPTLNLNFFPVNQLIKKNLAFVVLISPSCCFLLHCFKALSGIIR